MQGHILVAEDDGRIREIVTEALEPLGVPIRTVATGQALVTSVTREPPLLVLMDLGLPDREGLSVIEQLKADPSTSELPILMLTGADDPDIDAGLAAGADDYIRKPFRNTQLLTRVGRILSAAERLHEVEKRERYLKTIVELTQLLASATDVRQALSVVVSAVVPMTRADRVSVVLARGADTAYVLASSDNRDLRDLPIAIQDYPELMRCLDTHETVVVSDVNQHELFAGAKRSLPFSSMALVPIADGPEAFGILFTRAKTANQLDLAQLPLLRTLARSAGVAIRNARLLQSLRTESRQNVEAVRQAQRRLKLFQPYAEFFKNAADGMVVMDPASGRILFANSVAKHIARFSGNLEGSNVQRFIREEDMGKALAIAEGFKQGEYPRGIDFKLGQTADGPVVSVNFSATLRTEGAVLFTFRDVTKERQTENELMRTTQFLERVIDSSVDAIVSADISGTVLVFNRAAARIFGYKQADVVRKMSVERLYPEGVARQVMRHIRSRNHGGKDRLRDYQVDMKDSRDRLIPVRISAALIYEDGKPVGSVGVFTDIRNELRMRAKLKHAQHEIQTHEKSVAVAQLAGATAHELNQPLTSVIAYAEMLSRKLEGDANLQRAAHVIVDQAERMANIVRQIGRITRYETKSYVGNARILDIEKSSQE